jgi:transketolase
VDLQLIQASETIGLDERSVLLRESVIEALEGGGRGHVGSTLSLIEIFRALYDEVLSVRPDAPDWPDRDRCILSKGHGCIALYVLLADKGFFPVEALADQCRPEAMLGGHPERAHIPGVEASTGALGHGLSIGVGMALGLRLKGRTEPGVYVVMGDGELDEGSVWEAAMAAAKHRLSNLVALVDYNKLQSYGPVPDVLGLEPLADKWRAFGFSVFEENGHDVPALAATLRKARACEGPAVVICHTVKGKGFDMAEGRADWHHKAKIGPADAELMRAALSRAPRREA